MSFTLPDKLRKKAINLEAITCKPLYNYHDILSFLENPPPWRTLCKELTPRSKYVLRNIDQFTGGESWHEITDIIEHESPLIRNYCHFPPGADTPKRYDTTQEKLPKTLVCHDMANGYNDDSVMGGTTNYSQYTFYNWAAIDIFCYFSHHLITIPPLAWINVGHAHGVKVIGTIITEWAEGALFWEKVLSSTTEYQNFASAMVAIAKTLKFDGYLLNIENKVSQPTVLLDFVKHLHETLHRELDDPVLIWYDSVTIKGKLSWQNELNQKNIDFFNACDGFFTNYSWSVDDVERSAKLAGARLSDLYIGIDVWGRNFHGGGQFNLQEAVKIVYNEGCSLAIFAPAWTHESMNRDQSDMNYIIDAEGLNSLERFTLRDRALWGTLWPYLYTHIPRHLPFQTSFCRGQGKKRWMYGEVISPGPWYNLRHQQYQPNAAHGQHGYMFSPAKIQPSKPQRCSSASSLGPRKGIIKCTRDAEDKPAEGQESPAEGGAAPAAVSTAHSAPAVTAASTPVVKRSFSSKLKHLIHRLSRTSIKRNRDDDNGTQAGTSLKNEDDTDVNIGTSFAKATAMSSGIRLVSARTAAVDDTTTAHMESPSVTRMEPSTNKLALQMQSKMRWELTFKPSQRECLQVYLKDAFNGGSCLRVNAADAGSSEHRLTRLLHCDFFCVEELIICVVTKTLSQYQDQSLNLILVMENKHGQQLEVLLLGRSLGLASNLNANSAGINCVYPVASNENKELEKLRRYLLIEEPDFYVPIDNQFGWDVRYYTVSVPQSRVMEINCRTVLEHGGILLGHLGICNRKPGL